MLIETTNQLIPVEIKSSQTVNSDFFTGLEDWLALAQPRQPQAWLVYGGGEAHQRKSTRVISWQHLPVLTDLRN
jgi:predicted RNA polymerase sigma factor